MRREMKRLEGPMGIKEEKRSGEERKNEREWRRERGRAGAGGGERERNPRKCKIERARKI